MFSIFVLYALLSATFTVLCYNVLCDKYATYSQYSYCPSWALNWEYRKKSVLNEIKSYDADVITLQEVETEQFYVYFLPEMAKNGYSGIFSPKSRAKTMLEDERKFVDGCAIFYKADKFELVKEHLIEFTQIAIDKADGCKHMLNRVMTRDNIALVAVLQPKNAFYGGQCSPAFDSLDLPLVICTAHIHWDPELCDVKLVQTMMLVQELDHILKELASTYKIPYDHVPALVCGDLNSLPESGVYEFLSTGKIDSHHPDLKDFRGQSCLKLLSSTDEADVYTHPLQLQSAYDPVDIPFTNYTGDFRGVIDYVFFSPVSLTRLGVLGPLDPEWFVKNKVVGCPHPNVPSDHIPLLVEYAIMPPPRSASTSSLMNFDHSSSGAVQKQPSRLLSHSNSSSVCNQQQQQQQGCMYER